jgi:hypothetical protein
MLNGYLLLVLFNGAVPAFQDMPFVPDDIQVLLLEGVY